MEAQSQRNYLGFIQNEMVFNCSQNTNSKVLDSNKSLDISLFLYIIHTTKVLETDFRKAVL